MHAAPGDRVRHPHYGPGTVLAARDARRVLVRFDRQRLMPRTVPLEELVAQAPEEQVVEAEETVRPAPAGETVLAARLRQTIEALRLGVVPAHFVGDYTVGRAREIERLRALLDAGRGLLLIWGEYGAGKTHLLDLAEQQAHASNYATARIVLDPHEMPPSHPQRLYARIVRALRYPGQVSQGLEPLLEALAGSLAHLDQDRHSFSRFLSPALFAHDRGDAALLAWTLAWLEGRPLDPQPLERVLRAAGWRGPRLLALSDFRTYGRVYVHIVGALAAWLADAGLRGLVVLFDEVERIEALDAEQRRFAVEVLKHYAAATLPPAELAFAEDDLYRGGHEVHRRLPLRYRDEQPLLVLMTLTPLPEALRAAQRALATRAHELSLAPLGPRELGELIDRVIDLYRRAYPELRPPAAGLEPVRRALARGGEDKPREVVRRVVASLDALRYRGAAHSAREVRV